ncbi:MAG: PAS domain S-box protein [Acidobacteriota bacterium]|nr:PAS domain S-box protein [Acidobacteriota bacterium]
MHSQAPLAQLDPKFQTFLEAAPDAIVVVDGSGIIVAVNALAGTMFGYESDQLLGQPIEVLVPERFRPRHVEDRQTYSSSPRTRPMGAGRTLTGRTRDGSEFPLEISLSPMHLEDRTLTMSSVRDVTERRRAQELMQASLREKEALLREIHHRVKNNLQITSSLLRLQEGAIGDPQAREVFAGTQHRIRSMALVHEKLYPSTNLSQIDFADYIRTLGDLLMKSFAPDPAPMTLRVGGAMVLLGIDVAVPCGLIINELLSNALKHAFPDERRGTIAVELEDCGDGICQVLVRDDGIGLPPNLDPATVTTLGLQLVAGLVQQIDGTLTVVSGDGGTAFTIRFPMRTVRV